MKKHLLKLPFLAVTALGFYLMPLLIDDTGSAMSVLLVWLPVMTAVVSALYGTISGFIDLIYCAAVGILFIPVVYIHLNDSALIYTGIYALIALIADALGALLKKATAKTTSKEKQP